MAIGKVIGQIQVTQGNIKVVDVNGVVREARYDGYVYENEQVISNDPNAIFQIKFLALPEASAYDGIFRILADGSVIHGRDAMDSMMSDENLVSILETEGAEDLETAAGEEGAEGSSVFTETDIVAQSSVLGFSRGANSELGFGITDFGSTENYDAAQITPPAITSPNVVIYDENGTEPVIQITATAEGSVTYSISGLDSDFFDIDPATGLVTFKESPDFENPRDSGGDNEYNVYVTATDTFGNYTTQLLSVSINNLNEAVTAFDDTVDAVEDTILSSTIDLSANDTDLDGGRPNVVAGTFATAQGGEIVIASDGSYTYTPPTNFNGTDSVNYTVTDGEFSDIGTLTINVGAVNDATVVAGDNVETDEDTPITINVLANDTDAIDENTATLVSATDGANGTTSVNIITGEVTYTPNANFNGSDSFTYTNSEGNTATVNVTVNPIADFLNESELNVVVGEPLINTGNIDPSYDENNATNIFEYNGLVITSSTDVLKFAPGLGIGAQTNINDGNQIDYTVPVNETVTVLFPNQVTNMALEVKNIVGDEIKVVASSEGEVIGFWLFTKIDNNNYTANFTQMDENGNPLSPVNVNWELATGNAADVIYLESPVMYDSIVISDNNEAGKGFSLLNIFDPLIVDTTTFTYPLYITAEFDTLSSDSIVNVTLGDLPEDSVLQRYDAVSGEYIALDANEDGTYTFDADELSELELSIVTQDPLADGYEPLISAVVVDGASTSTTIYGGSEGTEIEGAEYTDYIGGGDGDDVISGYDGNDYINGDIGSDSVYSGAGNDTIVYDIADTEIDGEAGTDTLIATSGVVDLSNVSNIEVIQLNSGATVIGSGVDGINANDVMNATDADNTLIIQSVDENTNTINIDTSSLPFSGNVDGYDIYTNGSVILQVEDDIEVI